MGGLRDAARGQWGCWALQRAAGGCGVPWRDPPPMVPSHRFYRFLFFKSIAFDWYQKSRVGKLKLFELFWAFWASLSFFEPQKGQFFWLWLKEAQNWFKIPFWTRKGEITLTSKFQISILSQRGSNIFNLKSSNLFFEPERIKLFLF